MTTERFNQLLAGPLHHQLVPFQVTRLALALKYVVDGCGKQGADMLEAYCEAREQKDEEFDDDETSSI